MVRGIVEQEPSLQVISGGNPLAKPAASDTTNAAAHYCPDRIVPFDAQRQQLFRSTARERQVACDQDAHPLAVQNGDQLRWPVQLLAKGTRTMKCLARLGRKVALGSEHGFANGNLKIKFMLHPRDALGQVRNQR